jgi:hypothetical protein
VQVSFGYNACEAIRMELSSLPMVRTAVLATRRADAYEVPGSQTKAGQVLGGSVRGLAKFIQAIPGATLMLDTVMRSYSLDVLTAQLRRDSRNPLLLVQTAEAQVRVAQLYRLIRLARTIDPTSAATSEILRLVASMGQKRVAPGKRLAAVAYRLTLDRIDHEPDFLQNLVLARSLRLLGRPGDAAQHAKRAGMQADREFAASGFSWDALSFWERLGTWTIRTLDRIDVRANGVEPQLVKPDGAPVGTDAQELWRLRRGAALMTWSRAVLDAGRTDQAVDLARKAAETVGFACAREVIAEARPPGTSIAAGIDARLGDLMGIPALDRNYYYGRWNGSLRIVAGVTAVQVEKLGRWFQ